MGTRHLIAVQIDGEYKIAQYGQWDGYPSGQGTSVLAFISKVMADTAALETFKSRLRALVWADLEKAQADLDKIGPSQFWANHPQLSRDCGSDVLGMVLESDAPMALKNSIDFAMDSLYCEWAYVIDFDSNTFEVFKGFNQAPASGRFAGPVQVGNEGPGTEGYGPVQNAMVYPLDQLPSEEEFLSALEPKEEDE